MAFNLFDKDGSGTIAALEVKATLIGADDVELDPYEEKFWREIIDEVDIDGNGEIDFDEFCIMLRKIVIQD